MYTVLVSIFSGGMTKNLYGSLLARFSVPYLLPFGEVWVPICKGKGYPRFWTCVFKLHLLLTMWPIFVEFRSTSSEGTWRKKKKERRIPVKHKSADRYRPIGRPNYSRISTAGNTLSEDECLLSSDIKVLIFMFQVCWCTSCSRDCGDVNSALKRNVKRSFRNNVSSTAPPVETASWIVINTIQSRPCRLLSPMDCRPMQTM